MLLITVLGSTLPGEHSEWTKQVVRIGRAPSCDVRFDDQAGREISGHHAEIVRDETGYVLLDTASTNGTWVNGERIGKHRLASGDVVHLGGDHGIELRVEIAPDPPEATPARRAPAPDVPRMLGTPAPRAPARPAGPASPAAIAEQVKRLGDTAVARAADVATHKVERERAKVGGQSSGQTIAIMAEAMVEVQQATRKKSGRRWKKVVAAVAGAGLLAAGIMGVVILQQRREIQRLVAQKEALDREIASVQEAMERESDAGRLEDLEDRLTQLAGSAESTLGKLARQDRAAARDLEAGGDDLDRAIRRILVKFDAPTYAVPPVFKEALQREVDELARATNLRFVYARRNRYWPLIQREFAALGLPEEMAYIAWAETQFDPERTSPVGARGMWQMTASTARALGLRVDAEVDERLEVPKQTRAAARYLANLLAEFGSDSFMLAMASYNRGESGVRRVLHQIAKEKDGFRKEKRDFWHLYRMKRLPAETRDYVPRVLAAAVVCGDPHRYGLASP